MFEWTMQSDARGTKIKTGGDIGGHINSLGHEPHNYTAFYVMVDDVAAALTKAASLGGKKLVGPVPLPDGTSFGWFADPEGNMIGVYAQNKSIYLPSPAASLSCRKRRRADQPADAHRLDGGARHEHQRALLLQSFVQHVHRAQVERRRVVVIRLRRVCEQLRDLHLRLAEDDARLLSRAPPAPRATSRPAARRE